MKKLEIAKYVALGMFVLAVALSTMSVTAHFDTKSGKACNCIKGETDEE